jgi:tetratricopeptide (TPR) repeat protein
MSVTLNKLKLCVKREENLSHDLVKFVWDELKSSTRFLQEQEPLKEKKKGCCGGGGSSKKDSKSKEKREESELVQKIETQYVSSNGAQDQSIVQFVGSFEPLLKLKEAIYATGQNGYYAQLLNKIGLLFYCLNEFEKALMHLQKSRNIRRTISASGSQNNQIKEEEYSETLNNLGITFYSLGELKDAQEFLQTSLNLRSKLNQENESKEREELVAESFNNLGMVYFAQNDFDKALDYFGRALEKRQKLLSTENQADLSESLNNLGMAYYGKQSYAQSLDYLTQSLKLRESLYSGNAKGHTKLATTLNNIGMCYYSMRDFTESLVYLKRSLLMRKELDLSADVATSLNNLGVSYFYLNDLTQSKEHLEQSLRLRKELFLVKNSGGGVKARQREDGLLVESYNNLGMVYFDLRMYSEALECFKSSLNLKQKQKRSVEFDEGQEGEEVDEGEAEIRASKVRNPNVDHLHKYIAQCYLNLDQFSKALEYGKSGEANQEGETIRI